MRQAHVDIIRALHGKDTAVVGGGVSGRAAARLLHALGANVLVSDAVSRDKAHPELLALEEAGIALELGGHSAALSKAALVVLSPGVDPRHPVIATLSVTCGEIELGAVALEMLSGGAKPRYAAITGTNGKTTTTALLGHICKSADLATFIGGNIGEPLCHLALAVHNGAAMPSICVLELSSYQCEELHTFDADVAAYLNLTPDHLDRYADMDAYHRAKARLFELQSEGHVSVLNRDNAYCHALAATLRTQVVELSCATTASGAEWDEARDAALIHADQARVQLDGGVLLGAHNRENQLAAILCARALGIGLDAIQRGLDTFAGVEHRIERVATIGGVTYFNDSKGTNDDAASKAIGAMRAPVIWLAGGKDKGGGYSASVHAARDRVKLAVVFGQAAPLIEAALAGVCPVTRVSTLAEAVKEAATLATGGDAVLLSPACSSFDQFKNYEERGRSFKALVRELEAHTATRGTP